MKTLYLRKVLPSDIDLLFKWANDPIVRQNSFNSKPILYRDHISWFERIMNDTSVLQYILMEEDVPIGQIRLDVKNDSAEISYSIAADQRGKGYGRKMLQLLVDEVKQNNPQIKQLTAKVKPQNTASENVFEREGYDLIYKCYSLKI